MLSVFISAINKVISKVMQKLASVMKYSTVTDMYGIQTMFTTIALFVNTTVVFTYVQAEGGDYFSDGGWLETAFYIMCTNAFMTPIVYVFDPEYYFFFFLQKITKRRQMKLGLKF